MRREEVLRSIPIGRSDFVVEIGAGHNPFHATDLIIDKYPFDNFHRFDDILCTAPVIKADAIKLPLAPKGCDLLFASHLIEHLAEPAKFINEVKRCSKRVYLEFPSVTRELMYAWSFHEWLIEVKDRHLVFYRNDIPQLFGPFFHQHYDVLLDVWSSQRFDELNSYVYSESEELSYEFATESAFEHVLSFSPRGREKVNRATTADVRYVWTQLAKVVAHRLMPDPILRLGIQLRRVWRRGTPRLLNQAIVDRLVCQRCSLRELRLKNTEIVCDACGTVYGQLNGVFDLDA
jgi:SAM-dependent methyltransferase